MTKVNSIDPELEQYVGKAARNSSKRAVKEKPAAIKEKFVEARLAKVVEIKAMTENQSKALQLMKKTQVVVLKGSSGAGKTMLACTTAANGYLKGDFERIVLIRPYEMVSKTVGLIPGTLEQKLHPLMQSMLQPLEKVFGKAELAAKITEGTVVMESLENVRGRSYGKSFIIVDEGQNVNKHAMKALLTRLEDTSKLVICGDGRQKDTKDESGIDWISDLMDKTRKSPPPYLSQEDMYQAHNNFGVVTFTNNDIVRGGFCGLMVKLFDGEGV
jgi:predicted ribonuclease YlaK